MDQAAEEDFGLVFAATRNLRSLAAQYNLQKDVDGKECASPSSSPLITVHSVSPLLLRKGSYNSRV
jgi:hypothetical protein